MQLKITIDSSGLCVHHLACRAWDFLQCCAVARASPQQQGFLCVHMYVLKRLDIIKKYRDFHAHAVWIFFFFGHMLSDCDHALPLSEFKRVGLVSMLSSL